MSEEKTRLFEKLIIEKKVATPEQLEEARRLAATNKTELMAELKKLGCDEAKMKELAQFAAVRTGAEHLVIGGFEIISEIGRGGMGAVYKARQVNMNRDVALKLMKPQLAKDKRNTERFLREAHASAKLSHPNIVQGIDAGQDKGYFYFAMEYIEGETLKHMIEKQGKIPEEYCVKVGIQMAKALEIAHKHSMIHRDVKPENILIEKSTGLAKLADMGLAKSTNSADTSVTQTGVALGTPNYISPEQARGEDDLDTRCDIYSLGATLYHAATGTLPFTGETAPVVMSKHMTQPLDPPTKRNPELSMRFSRIIQKMMAKKKEARYENPSALLTALENLSRPAESTPQPEKRASAPVKSDNKSMIIAGVIAGVVLLVGLIAWLLSGPSGPPSRTGEATAFYTRAQEVFNSQPNNTEDILNFLNQCIQADPEGPNAAPAKALQETVNNYKNLSAVKAANSADTLKKMKDLIEFGNKYKGSALQKAILVKVKEAAVEGINREIDAVRNSPIKAPEVMNTINELASVAANDEVKAVREEARNTIKKIINDNTEQIFAEFIRPVDDLAIERNYKKAIEVLATAVPADFRNEKIVELTKIKGDELASAAGDHFKLMAKDVYGALDGLDLDGSKKALEDIKAKLDIPRNSDLIRDLGITVQLAEKFVPEFKKLDEIEKTAPIDEKAYCELAKKIISDYGHDPYVSGKKQGLEDKIKGFAAAALDKELKAKLANLYDLMGKNAYQEASDLATALINDPKSSADLKKAAAELILTIPNDQRLLLHIVNNIKAKVKAGDAVKVNVNLPGKTGATACPVKEVSMEKVTVSAPDGKEHNVIWANLLKEPDKNYKSIVLSSLPENDPDAQFCLSNFWTAISKGEQTSPEARKAIEKSLQLAEELTAEKYPARDAVIREAKIIILKMDNKDAADLLAKIGTEVKQIKGDQHAQRLLQGLKDLEVKYGHTVVVDNREGKEAIQKNLNIIADWLVRNSSTALANAIKDGKWDKVEEICNKIIDEVGKIVSVPEQTKKNLEKTIEFSKLYMAQQTIYKDVFATLPWNKGKLDVLRRHPDEMIQKAAEGYAKFLEVEIKKFDNSKDQWWWAEHKEDKEGKLTVWIDDPITRIGRRTSIFHYFINDQAAVENAELAIIRDLGHFGENSHAMQLCMLDNAMKIRPKLLGPRRAAYAMTRVNSMNDNSGRAPMLKFVAQQTARAYMNEFSTMREAVDFCYRYAQLSAELNEYDEAMTYFTKIIDQSKTFPSKAYESLLSRGALKEKIGKPEEALEDYMDAFKQEFKKEKEWNWDSAFWAGAAIVRVSAPSGKLPNSDVVEKIRNVLIKRAPNPDKIKQATDMLDKYNK